MLFLLSQCCRMMRRRQMPRDVIIRGESMLPALLPGDRHCVEYRGRSRLHDIVVVRLDSYIIGCDDCSGCPHCHAMPRLAVKRVVLWKATKFVQGRMVAPSWFHKAMFTSSVKIRELASIAGISGVFQSMPSSG